MANSWLRLWHDMPNDPKWRTIARLSGQPVALVLATYVHLLVSASQSVTRGHADVTPEDLASALDVTDRDIEQILEAMQGRVLDGKNLTGWGNRQVKREDTGNPETGAKSARERKNAQRERQRLAKEKEACHEESRNVTTDKDKDKDKDLKDKTPHIKRAGANGPPLDDFSPPEQPTASGGGASAPGMPDERPSPEPPGGDWLDEPGVKFPMTADWVPPPDFKQRAALWGNILSGPAQGYTRQELASFTAYWKAEGKAFHQVQWEQKFARHLASQSAGLPQAGKSGRQRRGGFEPSGNYDEKPAGFS
ncbi:DnaT-like ssDNA-binding domain-containing protein [Serratia odorifera]|nr:DnaT-like ssDNA-binding domain-containing protein [Serratia odorifera]VDZ64178.1 Primosomal protein I [Serratia odorifera]